MTMVRFDQEQRGVLSLLDVEAGARPGLARAIQGALFELRVQVVRSRTIIAGGRRVQRLELVEFDGGRLDRRRRAEIEDRIRRAAAAPRRPRRAAARFVRTRAAA